MELMILIATIIIICLLIVAIDLLNNIFKALKRYDSEDESLVRKSVFNIKMSLKRLSEDVPPTEDELHEEEIKNMPLHPGPSWSAWKKCPDCAQMVKEVARKCRYCGHQFSED